MPTIGERIVHMPGDGSTMRTFPTKYGQISGLCCGENSNPLAVSVLAAEYTVVHVANWPNHLFLIIVICAPPACWQVVILPMRPNAFDQPAGRTVKK